MHVDPVSGVAGDMLLGAVLDAGVPLDALTGPLQTLPLPPWALEATPGRRLGLAGTRATVRVRGEDAGSAWHHAPAAAHPHHHLADLVAVIEAGHGLPGSVRERAVAAFRLLAEAEGAAHGTPVEDTHLHEVGAADAVIDLCGGLLGLHLLGATSVSCGPIPLGSGTVRCAHGVMPVPVPAVAELLRGLPTVPGAGAHPTGELSTPTGVALLRGACDTFGPPPPMRLLRLGVGLGTRERADVPNVVRLLLGAPDGAARPEAQAVVVLSATLDDLDGRLLPHVVARLLDEGALDVIVTPSHGKKGRPALVLSALAPDDAARERLAGVLFRETPTLGVRWHREHRQTLPRQLVTVQTPYGPVRVKEGTLDGLVVTRQPEWEDVAARAAAHGVPARTVLAAALAAANPE